MLKNKRGETVFTVIATLVVLSVGSGFVQTYKDGTLKKNGSKIWCKMKNQGNAYCDNKYN